MPLLKALLAQLGGLAAVFALAQSGWLQQTPPLELAVMQGAAAGFFSAGLKADRWWLPIHFCFLPAIVLASKSGLPYWLYAGCFLALALVYWTSFRTQVPLFLSNKQTLHRLAWRLAAQPGVRILDIGSGTGSFVRTLALLRPEWSVSGIETAPAPFALSRWRTRRLSNVSLTRADFWQQSLADFDLVYAFLSPAPMQALWSKALKEMRPGSLLISNSFEVPSARPDEIVHINDRRNTRLFIYRPRGTVSKPE